MYTKKIQMLSVSRLNSETTLIMTGCQKSSRVRAMTFLIKLYFFYRMISKCFVPFRFLHIECSEHASSDVPKKKSSPTRNERYIFICHQKISKDLTAPLPNPIQMYSIQIHSNKSYFAWHFASPYLQNIHICYTFFSRACFIISSVFIIIWTFFDPFWPTISLPTTKKGVKGMAMWKHTYTTIHT